MCLRVRSRHASSELRSNEYSGRITVVSERRARHRQQRWALILLSQWTDRVWRDATIADLDHAALLSANQFSHGKHCRRRDGHGLRLQTRDLFPTTQCRASEYVAVVSSANWIAGPYWTRAAVHHHAAREHPI